MAIVPQSNPTPDYLTLAKWGVIILFGVVGFLCALKAMGVL